MRFCTRQKKEEKMDNETRAYFRQRIAHLKNKVNYWTKEGYKTNKLQAEKELSAWLKQFKEIKEAIKEIKAEQKEEGKIKNYPLTEEQANLIRLYIISTEGLRKRERESILKLNYQLKNGEKKYPNMYKTYKRHLELETRLEEIKKVLS